MEEDILNFVSITSADPQKAAQYLQLADNNLEQAIQLYFDSPNLDVGSGSSVAQPSANAPSNAHNPISIDSDEDMSDFDAPESAPRAAPHTGGNMEDDEAMARRLQEEMYGAMGPEGDVRAPLARTTETLVGGPDSYDPGDLDDLVAQQMAARRARPAGMQSPYWILLRQMRLTCYAQDEQASSTSDRRNLPFGRIVAIRVPDAASWQLPQVEPPRRTQSRIC